MQFSYCVCLRNVITFLTDCFDSFITSLFMWSPKQFAVRLFFIFIGNTNKLNHVLSNTLFPVSGIYLEEFYREFFACNRVGCRPCHTVHCSDWFKVYPMASRRILVCACWLLPVEILVTLEVPESSLPYQSAGCMESHLVERHSYLENERREADS